MQITEHGHTQTSQLSAPVWYRDAVSARYKRSRLPYECPCAKGECRYDERQSNNATSSQPPLFAADHLRTGSTERLVLALAATLIPVTSAYDRTPAGISQPTYRTTRPTRGNATSTSK